MAPHGYCAGTCECPVVRVARGTRALWSGNRALAGVIPRTKMAMTGVSAVRPAVAGHLGLQPTILGDGGCAREMNAHLPGRQLPAAANDARVSRSTDLFNIAQVLVEASDTSKAVGRGFGQMGSWRPKPLPHQTQQALGRERSANNAATSKLE